MITGGICFIDEIGKITPKALSLLASVLDDRQSLTSVLAGFTVTAAPEFRFCAALNDADAAMNGLPGFLDERLRPVFRLTYPDADELLQIVATRVPAATAALLDRFKRRLAERRRPLSPRQALKVVSFAARLSTSRAATAARCDLDAILTRAFAAVDDEG
jgi:MoxR-like ATPase